MDCDVERAVCLLERHLLQTGEMLVRYLKEHASRGGADSTQALTELQQRAVTIQLAQTAST